MFRLAHERIFGKRPVGELQIALRPEVILVKGMINALLALVFLAATAVSFYSYTNTTPPNNLYIILAVVFALLMVVFGGMFLSGRVNKSEEIHITE